MNITKKRDILGHYCGSTSCGRCPLSSENNKTPQEWEKPLFLGCPDFAASPEKDLDKAIKILGLDVSDVVNRPAHYTDGKIEPIEFIEDKKLGFCLGNAIKYIARAGKKDPSKEVEDLKKARWYIERRIKEIEEGIV